MAAPKGRRSNSLGHSCLAWNKLSSLKQGERCPERETRWKHGADLRQRCTRGDSYFMPIRLCILHSQELLFHLRRSTSPANNWCADGKSSVPSVGNRCMYVLRSKIHPVDGSGPTFNRSTIHGRHPVYDLDPANDYECATKGGGGKCGVHDQRSKVDIPRIVTGTYNWVKSTAGIPRTIAWVEWNDTSVPVCRQVNKKEIQGWEKFRNTSLFSLTCTMYAPSRNTVSIDYITKATGLCATNC